MNENSHPVWKRLSKKTVYKGRLHIVEHQVQLPNGEHSKYEVDHSPTFAATVLIKTPDNCVILTRQFRFPLNRWIYDLPGGAQAQGETEEEAAIRECREEIGIRPKKMIKLGMFYHNPGRSDWPTYIFFCDQYEESGLKINDPSETIERIKMPVLEFRKLVDDQKIIDPALLISWFSARNKDYI